MYPSKGDAAARKSSLILRVGQIRLILPFGERRAHFRIKNKRGVPPHTLRNFCVFVSLLCDFISEAHNKITALDQFAANLMKLTYAPERCQYPLRESFLMQLH